MSPKISWLPLLVGAVAELTHPTTNNSKYPGNIL